MITRGINQTYQLQKGGTGKKSTIPTTGSKAEIIDK